MHRRLGRTNNNNINNNEKELRTIIHRKDNNTNNNNNNNKLSAIVVIGEASESDDDDVIVDNVNVGNIDDLGDQQIINDNNVMNINNDDDDILGNVKQIKNNSIDHEQQKRQTNQNDNMTETNFTKNFNINIDNNNDNKQFTLINKNNIQGVTSIPLSSSSSSTKIKRPILNDFMTKNENQNKKNDSLLHLLLKDSNEQVKQNLIKLSCSPYLMAEKDYSEIIRNFLSTQKLLQKSCQILQKTINDDINQLDKSFITLFSTIMSNNNNKLLS